MAPKITGDFDWRVNECFSFVQGHDALSFYGSVRDSELGWCNYDSGTRTFIGSNFPFAARLDTILKSLGARVAGISDLQSQEILNMVRGRCYSDTPSLVLRSMNDIEPNLPIIKILINEMEKRHIRVQLPCLITGLDAQPIRDSRGYGWAVVPRNDFKVICDERLDYKYDGGRFSVVDEIGLPLFDKNGLRIWHARDGGIARLLIGKDLSLYSNTLDLPNSFSEGRIIVISPQNPEIYTPAQIIRALKSREVKGIEGILESLKAKHL